MQPFSVSPKLDLVGSQELAAMLGFTQQHVNRMVNEGELPEPDGEIGTGQIPYRVWERKTIEDWAERTGRTLKSS